MDVEDHDTELQFKLDNLTDFYEFLETMLGFMRHKFGVSSVDFIIDFLPVVIKTTDEWRRVMTVLIPLSQGAE